MADQFPPSDGRGQPGAPRALPAALTLLVSAVIVAILYFAREVVIPITLAVLLSLLLAPPVRWLQRRGLGRISSVAVAVTVAFLVILGFGGIVVQEVSSLAQGLQNYRYNLQTKVQSFPNLVPGRGVFHRATEMLHELRSEMTNSEIKPSTLESRALPTDQLKPVPVQIQPPELEPLQIVEGIIEPLLRPLATSGLVILFVILILLDRQDLRDRLIRLAGRGDLQRTTEAMDDAAQRISRYLRSQLLVNASCAVPIGLGLTVIGIPNAALWAIMTLVLRFIPYLGIVIAASLPLALAIAVAPGWNLLLWTILLFVIVELVVSNVVEPFVYGDTTGVSPVALIAATTFWTWLWGPIGLLLSTPMTVCLAVLGRHVPQLQFLHVVLGNQPALTPEETFYQRMLANDPEEATQQAEEFAKEKSLAAFFDEVAVPALARAQADSDRGALPPDRRKLLTEGFTTMLENLCDFTEEEADPVKPRGVRNGEAEPQIVCVAGRNELDEAAAQCLAHLLRRQQDVVEAQVVSADALGFADLTMLALRSATLVYLSLISTNSPARARYLVRRVRRRAHGAKVVVGFLGSGETEFSAADVITATTADAVTCSLHDAIAEIDALIDVERRPARVG